MNNNSIDSNYVPPPQLPGVVYACPLLNKCGNDLYRSNKLFFIFISFFIIVGAFNSEASVSNIGIFLVIFTILFFIINKTINQVYLTREHAEARYGCRKIKKETKELHSYFILVKKASGSSRYHGKHYGYSVYLAPKNILPEELIEGGCILPKVGTQVKAFSANMVISWGMRSVEKKGGFPISNDIYTPENLKEYVDAVKSQVAISIPVLFESEQVRRDYMTGKYRS